MLIERLDSNNQAGPSKHRIGWPASQIIIVRTQIKLYRMEFFQKNNRTYTIIQDFRVY